jgi:hypothetical protein
VLVYRYLFDGARFTNMEPERPTARDTVRILYLADIRFPLERANGIQSMETCHALAARGHEVTLVVRPDSHTPARDPFAFYGLPPLHAFRIEVAGSSTWSASMLALASLVLAERTWEARGRIAHGDLLARWSRG